MGTEPTEQSFSEFVEDRVGDLGNMALLSGVDHGTLRLLDKGQATPSHGHERALTKAMPDLPPELLYQHARPEPEHVTTRRGSVPEGHELVFIEAQELVAKDLVLYHPAVKTNGTHWVAVDDDPVLKGRSLFLTVGGGSEVWTSPEQIMRVARATKKSLVD